MTEPANSQARHDHPLDHHRILIRSLPIVILFLASLGAWVLWRTKPVIQAQVPLPDHPQVHVLPLAPGQEQVTIQALGRVIPQRRLNLFPQVSGTIVWLHPNFEEGGLIKAGETIVRLDARDYEMRLRERQADKVSAEFDLAVEEGNQVVAQADWQTLEPSLRAGANPSLTLREVHLRKAKADLDAAQARLESAGLDLDRTRIHAPFDVIVEHRHITLGSQATPQTEIGSFIATDTYWVRASIPLDQLQFFDLPAIRDGQSAPARIVQTTGLDTTIVRTGAMVKLLAGVESEGRMANLIVAIDDPLGLKSGSSTRLPLLIGSQVQVEVLGRDLDHLFAIPRKAYREGNRVWLLDDTQRLVIQPVTPVWRNRDHVFVREGLQPGDRLILTDLAVPQPGMQLRLENRVFVSVQNRHHMEVTP